MERRTDGVNLDNHGSAAGDHDEVLIFARGSSILRLGTVNHSAVSIGAGLRRSGWLPVLAWAGRQGPDVAHDVAHAIALAQDAHRGQFRYSGDPYVEHPIAVGLILSQIEADPPTVVAGVLHHLATTSMFDPLRVRESFGDTVGDQITALQIIDQSPTPPAATDHDRRALSIKIAH